MADTSMKLKQDTSKFSISNFFSYLLFSITQAHIFHFQTHSYAIHKALETYYEDVNDLVDTLVESYQGKFGGVKSYKCFDFKYDTQQEGPISLLKEVINQCEKAQSEIKESDLNNIIDEIKNLSRQTIYRIENLQ